MPVFLKIGHLDILNKRCQTFPENNFKVTCVSFFPVFLEPFPMAALYLIFYMLYAIYSIYDICYVMLWQTRDIRAIEC